jgi:hypothetical protein
MSPSVEFCHDVILDMGEVSGRTHQSSAPALAGNHLRGEVLDLVAALGEEASETASGEEA